MTEQPRIIDRVCSGVRVVLDQDLLGLPVLDQNLLGLPLPVLDQNLGPASAGPRSLGLPVERALWPASFVGCSLQGATLAAVNLTLTLTLTLP